MKAVSGTKLEEEKKRDFHRHSAARTYIVQKDIGRFNRGNIRTIKKRKWVLPPEVLKEVFSFLPQKPHLFP
ncbi:MAG: hypothetical protein JSV33_02130 [bacterium]|nr:MAG: hypothetical protein JSV33_02130 [bacterium]